MPRECEDALVLISPLAYIPYAEKTGSESCVGMLIGPGLRLRARRAFTSRFLPPRGIEGIGAFVLSLSISICKAKRQENASFPELWKLQRASTPKEVNAAGREITVFGARGFPYESTIGPRWPPKNNSRSKDAVSITCILAGTSGSVSASDNKKELGSKQLTYTHFGHALEITVSTMGDEDQVVGPGVRVGRAEAAEGT